MIDPISTSSNNPYLSNDTTVGSDEINDMYLVWWPLFKLPEAGIELNPYTLQIAAQNIGKLVDTLTDLQSKGTLDKGGKDVLDAINNADGGKIIQWVKTLNNRQSSAQDKEEAIFNLEGSINNYLLPIGQAVQAWYHSGCGNPDPVRINNHEDIDDLLYGMLRELKNPALAKQLATHLDLLEQTIHNTPDWTKDASYVYLDQILNTPTLPGDTSTTLLSLCDAIKNSTPGSPGETTAIANLEDALQGNYYSIDFLTTSFHLISNYDPDPV